MEDIRVSDIAHGVTACSIRPVDGYGLLRSTQYVRDVEVAVAEAISLGKQLQDPQGEFGEIGRKIIGRSDLLPDLVAQPRKIDRGSYLMDRHVELREGAGRPCHLPRPRPQDGGKSRIGDSLHDDSRPAVQHDHVDENRRQASMFQGSQRSGFAVDRLACGGAPPQLEDRTIRLQEDLRLDALPDSREVIGSVHGAVSTTRSTQWVSSLFANARLQPVLWSSLAPTRCSESSRRESEALRRRSAPVT